MSADCCLVQGTEQTVRVRDVKEGHGLSESEAEKVHPGVLVHSHTESPRHALRPESNADMPPVFGPIDLGRHAAHGRIGNGIAARADDCPAIGKAVYRSQLPPLLIDEPAEDEVEAHQHEGDAPEHEKGLLSRGHNHEFPKECEAAPEDAERHQEGVCAGKPDPRIRTTDP